VVRIVEPVHSADSPDPSIAGGSTPPDPPVTGGRDLALATWGLFLGLVLLMVAGGLFSTALGVRSELRHLPTAVSSLISAAYYAGFLVGSRLTLGALGRVGHIRVYGALASLLSAAIIAVGLTDSAPAWVLLRFVTGLCLAGQYVVAESWLNDLATEANRGRLLALYLLLTSGAFGLGQLFISAFDARTITAFAIASILTSLAVAPVALSEEAVAPDVTRGEHISLRELARTVPTGVGTILLVGLAHGAMIGMAAIYATRVGLSAARIGLFVGALQFGGVILVWPVAAASDDVDRRAVGVAAALGVAGAAALLLLGPARSPMAILLMAIVGGLSMPLYSIAGAYTNDWIEPEHLNAAASQLVTLYGIGAMFGPFAAAGLMIVIGPSGYYWSIIVLHALIAAFLVYRMSVWRAPLAKRPWSEVSIPARAFFIPATIVSMGRRRRRASN
jgi:MFS family permease